jgi:hypothetical protein
VEAVWEEAVRVAALALIIATEGDAASQAQPCEHEGHVFFFVGWAAWTLAEYLVHRFLLHWKSSVFWPEHLKHHQRPLADTGVPLHETVFISMYATAALWFCFGIDGALFAAGATLGYVVYVTLHETMHRARVLPEPVVREAARPPSQGTACELRHHHDAVGPGVRNVQRSMIWTVREGS